MPWDLGFEPLLELPQPTKRHIDDLLAPPQASQIIVILPFEIR